MCDGMCGVASGLFVWLREEPMASKGGRAYVAPTGSPRRERQQDLETPDMGYRDSKYRGVANDW